MNKNIMEILKMIKLFLGSGTTPKQPEKNTLKMNFLQYEQKQNENFQNDKIFILGYETYQKKKEKKLKKTNFLMHE